jgi:hypothetical protein
LQQYKMALLDELALVITVRDFDAADDTAALAHAYAHCTTHMIAVTQAECRVGEVTKSALIGGVIPLVTGAQISAENLNSPRRVTGVTALLGRDFAHQECPLGSEAVVSARSACLL